MAQELPKPEYRRYAACAKYACFYWMTNAISGFIQSGVINPLGAAIVLSVLVTYLHTIDPQSLLDLQNQQMQNRIRNQITEELSCISERTGAISKYSCS